MSGIYKVKGSSIEEGSIPLNALKNDIITKIENGCSNWNANEGEAGYIENRTHYEIQIPLSTTDYTFIEDFPKYYDDATERYYSKQDVDILYTEDGDDYLLTIPANTLLGYEHKTDVVNIEINDGEIFNFESYSDTGDIFIKVTRSNSGNNFRVVLYTQLDEKFIPDTIARKSDIPNIPAAALKYCGITTTPLTDGSTTNPVIIDGSNHTAEAGCVVFYEDTENGKTTTKEFVFNGHKWELLGSDLTYKVVQNAVSSPNASGSSTAFIDTISQDANGVINVTKKNVDMPIVKGDAEHSAVLKGETTVLGVTYKNEALNEGCVSLGANSKAGLKGYYFTFIDFNTNQIWLHNKQFTSRTLGALGGWKKNSVSDANRCGWAKDDVISFTCDGHYDNSATIVDVVDNVITVDELPFTIDDVPSTIISIEAANNKFDECSVFCVKKFNIGTVELGGNAFAIGTNTQASNAVAYAEGYNTVAYGKYSHAEGNETEAGYNAHAEGYLTKALGERSHAEGRENTAEGNYSHAEGKGTSAVGKFSHTEGYNTTANGGASHAEGSSTEAGENAHSEGLRTKATGDNSHAEGQDTVAEGQISHVEGYKSIAGGNQSHAEGYNTRANGENSHAEGNGSISDGVQSHAEGIKSHTIGEGSHAEGMYTTTEGKGAHSEGRDTIARGDYSHAEGKGNSNGNYGAFGWASHAEGYETITEGSGSHAEGYRTNAIRDFSHAEGCLTKAMGKNSHAEGEGTITHNKNEHASGRYNKSIESDDVWQATHFSIGIGTSDTDRKNAFEVKSNGDIYIEGVEGRIQDKLNTSTSITPDWNAQEGKAGYIKNRTHYSTTDKYEFEVGEMGYDSSDIYVGCYPGWVNDYEPQYYCEIKGFPCNVKIISDWVDTLSAEYTFSKPEDKVEVVWKDSNNNNCYNVYFHIDAYNGKYYFYAHGNGYKNGGYLPEWGPYTVTIEKLKQIDEKYIPSAIAKTKDIKCDWNAKKNQIGYIENRPFYEEIRYPDINGEIYVSADNIIELPYYYTAYPNNKDYEIRLSNIISGVILNPNNNVDEISVYYGESSWVKINSEQLFSDVTINGIKYKNVSMSDLGMDISFGESGGSDSGNPILYSGNLEAYIEYRIAPKIKKIDSKFLPDSIEKISDINIDAFVFEHMLNPFKITLYYDEDGIDTKWGEGIHDIGVVDQQLIDWLYGNNDSMIENRAILLNKIAYVVYNEHTVGKKFITCVEIEDNIIYADSSKICALVSNY